MVRRGGCSPVKHYVRMCVRCPLWRSRHSWDLPWAYYSIEEMWPLGCCREGVWHLWSLQAAAMLSPGSHTGPRSQQINTSMGTPTPTCCMRARHPLFPLPYCKTALNTAPPAACAPAPAAPPALACARLRAAPHAAAPAAPAVWCHMGVGGWGECK